ncbi:hypothetical protein Clacol_010313 [Clathrus columnatus]|uniref:Uncharacterized protein n=1 Tax=Clathrus columnatus TaxID=1419009 RepID=A0AAV5AN50_9AGAM|nr:hypothetical protein Clacol_010313 [Clathrus columnatus]
MRFLIINSAPAKNETTLTAFYLNPPVLSSDSESVLLPNSSSSSTKQPNTSASVYTNGTDSDKESLTLKQIEFNETEDHLTALCSSVHKEIATYLVISSTLSLLLGLASFSNLKPSVFPRKITSQPLSTMPTLIVTPINENKLKCSNVNGNESTNLRTHALTGSESKFPSNCGSHHYAQYGVNESSEFGNTKYLRKKASSKTSKNKDILEEPTYAYASATYLQNVKTNNGDTNTAAINWISTLNKLLLVFGVFLSIFLPTISSSGLPLILYSTSNGFLIEINILYGYARND